MSEFVIVTRDFSGLGWAVRLQDEGHTVLIACEPKEDEPNMDGYEQVGLGLIEHIPMEDAFKQRGKLRSAYWVFDSNHLWEYGDKLRREGFKVFGASEWTHSMEHDREYGAKMAKEAGLDLPETKQFTDAAAGVEFLEQRAEKAFVCKPDDVESHLTFVPQSETAEAANRELRSYLSLLTQPFMLQEKIKGVEINVECFFYRGKPYFAHANFECKRKNSGDKGELVGCAQDIDFVVPLDSELVMHTVGKLFPMYQRKNFTGFGDLNCILADNNKVYFLEWCLRFGYNSHPNLFFNLGITPLGELLIAMIDGKITNFYNHWRKGFGASISMYVDHPTMGFPIYIAPEVKRKFFCYDYYQDNSVENPETDFYLAGYDTQVGVVMGFGYTIKDAAKSALDNALKVNFPNCAYREDLHESDYPLSPCKRYEAVCAMGLL